MHRPIAPGLIQGAVRGLLAGAFTAAVAPTPLLVIDGVKLEGYALVAIAMIVCGTVHGATDGLEARIGPRWYVRGLSALIAGSLAGMVVASLNELVFRGHVGVPTDEVLEGWLKGGASAVLPGIALMIAGPHEKGASMRARYRRAAIAGGLVAAAPALLAVATMNNSGDFLVFSAAALIIVGIALLHCLGHHIARGAGRSVGQWLEPDTSWTLRMEARDEYTKLARDALKLRQLAESAKDERAKRAACERGLDAARSAFDIAEKARLELVREEAGRQLRYFLKALGRNEEAATLKV